MPKKRKSETIKTESEQIKELTGEVASLSAEADDLREQIHRLRLEKEALLMAAKLIKKEQGISLETLSNREKAIVIGALRNAYSLKELLELFHLSKSSYCYQKNALAAPDKYEDAREQLRISFTRSYESYGYRRMYLCIKQAHAPTV